MRKGFLSIGILVFFLSACVKELPMDIEELGLPVVNCVLVNDTVQKLSLTKATKTGGSYLFKEIKDASVVLRAGDAVVGRFERKGYDNWQLSYTPVAGTSYELEVQLPDGTTLSATTTMPKPNQFIEMRENNIHPSKYFRQFTAIYPTWVLVLGADNMPSNFTRPSGGERLRNLLGTDHYAADRFNEDGNLLDLVPDATTPAYRYYIRIPPVSDIDASGVKFCLQTNFGEYSFVCFRTASVEYDNYLKTSLQKMFVYIDEDDPGQWFDESRIYSNIQNGVGIFAAYSDRYFFYVN